MMYSDNKDLSGRLTWMKGDQKMVEQQPPNVLYSRVEEYCHSMKTNLFLGVSYCICNNRESLIY